MAAQPMTLSPHRDAIVQALSSYYELLVQFHYLPQSIIKTPPPTGWAEPHHALFSQLGKSDAVVDVLCHIPYLTNPDIHVAYETSAIDWRGPQVRGALDRGASLQDALLQPMLQMIPENVIALTKGSNYGRWLLLDVNAGIITNYSTLGGPDPKLTDEELESGTGWEKHEAKPVVEFFGDWERKLRTLWWTPLPSADGRKGEIRIPAAAEDPEQDEVRDIYREHGWGTPAFCGEECKTTVIEWERRRFQKVKGDYDRRMEEKAAARRARAAAAVGGGSST